MHLVRAVIDLNKVVSTSAKKGFKFEVVWQQGFNVLKLIVNVWLRLEDLTRLFWIEELGTVLQLLAGIFIKILIDKTLSQLSACGKDDEEHKDVKTPGS